MLPRIPPFNNHFLAYEYERFERMMSMSTTLAKAFPIKLSTQSYSRIC